MEWEQSLGYCKGQLTNEYKEYKFPLRMTVLRILY